MISQLLHKRHFYKNKRKTNVSGYNKLQIQIFFFFLKSRKQPFGKISIFKPKASSNGVRAGSVQLTDFPGLQFTSGVSVNFFE